MPHRILILMSDTGGGHRSAAEALVEAFADGYGDRCQVEMVDGLAAYAPFPLNRAGPLYPTWVERARWTYIWSYRLSDTPRRATAIVRTLWPFVRRRTRRLLREHPADVIISVHPGFCRVVPWTLRRQRRKTPFITVVTDLLTAHALWFGPESALTILPTEAMRPRALAGGVPPERLRVIGLPVARGFAQGLLPKAEARQRLGLPAEGPVALLMGGGEGMGRVYETAQALAAARLPITLVVITGRNAALRERLTAAHWPIPFVVQGFVRNMPEWMAAADVLITKAGPGTIAEAFIAGLPLVLNGLVPGQEEGNVTYVVDNGAGVWEPEPERIAARLAEWLGPGAAALRQMAEASRRLGRPGAARAIADEVMRLLKPPAA